MAAIKREQAEWMAEFLGTDVETLLQGFDEAPDEAPDDAPGDAPPTDQTDDAQTDDAPVAEEGEPDPGQTAHEPGTEPVAAQKRGEDKGFAGPDAALPVAALPVAAGPALPVVLLIAGAQYLTRELIANVTVTNNTEATLTLDKGAQMAHGELKGKKPKASLAPKETDSFQAHSTSLLSLLEGIPVLEWLTKGIDKLIGSPSLSGVEGTLKYLVGDASTTWTCHFDFPRLITSSPGGSGAVGGQNPNGAQDQSQALGKSEKWDFVLAGKGGGGGGGGGPSAAAVTCRVAVLNTTDQTIFLRHQDNIGGEFITNPKPKLGPGEQDGFMYGATANDKDRACRGKLFYDVADPKLVEWELMWDNRVAQKNISASFLNPKDNKSGLHTLDQIDNGDENVPVTFTLSGKGGGAPPSGQAGQYAVTMDNKTDAELDLSSSSVTGGTLVPPPPAKLAAGATAKMQFIADPTAKSGAFFAIWAVGQSGTSWFAKGKIPAGGDPAAEGPLNPANPSLSSTATATKAADGGSFAFTVSGTAGPPDKPDDDFAPPPKSKQPTLRKGDDSSDGWVEYAQRLLNKWSLSKGQPKDKVNGDFDAAMDKKVKAFQTDTNAEKVDGVIGNETWSILREGTHEKPSTDGRKPHSFKEKGMQGRFVTEQSDVTGYDAGKDTYFMLVVSTGEEPIDDTSATLKITQPDGTSHTHKIKIGPVTTPSGDGQGDFHALRFQPFSKIFKLGQGIDPFKCTADAYLDQAIGGDRLSVPVTPGNAT